MSSFVSKRVQGLPPYLFSVIDEKKKRLQEEGVDVIDLGIGAPDLPTPNFIVDRLIRSYKIQVILNTLDTQVAKNSERQ